LGITETKDLHKRGSTFSFNFENIDDAKAEKFIGKDLVSL